MPGTFSTAAVGWVLGVLVVGVLWPEVMTCIGLIRLVLVLAAAAVLLVLASSWCAGGGGVSACVHARQRCACLPVCKPQFAHKPVRNQGKAYKVTNSQPGMHFDSRLPLLDPRKRGHKPVLQDI